MVVRAKYSKNEFLSLPAAYRNDKAITVEDTLIAFAKNTVPTSFTRGQRDAFDMQYYFISDVPAHSNVLEGIARVLLKGIESLIKAIVER